MRVAPRQALFAVVEADANPRVLVQISAEITKPLDDRKFDGVFTINTELSPIASASFDVGRWVMVIQWGEECRC